MGRRGGTGRCLGVAAPDLDVGDLSKRDGNATPHGDNRLGDLLRRACASDAADHVFLPAIHYLNDMRAETAARVAVRGDRSASEVILYAARSHDLPATWPDGLARSPVASPQWHYWATKEAN